MNALQKGGSDLLYGNLQSRPPVIEEAKRFSKTIFKRIILMTVVLIFTSMIFGFTVFQKSATLLSAVQAQTFQELIGEDSPFGYLWSGLEGNTWQDRYGDAVNIGIRWHRGGTSVIQWERVQKNKQALDQGLFDWSHYDHEFLLLTQAGINIVANVDSETRRNSNSPFGLKAGSWLPINEDAYLRFVKAAVERYDGDGINDAPGGIKIKYWQVDNEVNLDSQRTSESYAEILKKTYAAIKEVDPEAHILMAGCGNRGNMGWSLDRDEEGHETLPYFKRIFSALKQEPYFDIFDWHYYGQTGDYHRLKEVIPVLQSTLAEYGYPNVPIWITEMSTYSGVLDGDPNNFQSENDQAVELVKRYFYALTLEVKKIFWAIGMMELGNDIYYGHTGLIYKDGVRKLAYYAYKKMAEVLEGSDWNNIQTIQEKGGTFIYKFKKNNKPIWVAWNDNPIPKIVKISGVGANAVKITEAIPNYDSGKEVTDYNTAFKTATKIARNDKITIILKDIPVFIETY